jgi:hypothetical protein
MENRNILLKNECRFVLPSRELAESGALQHLLLDTVLSRQRAHVAAGLPQRREVFPIHLGASSAAAKGVSALPAAVLAGCRTL